MPTDHRQRASPRARNFALRGVAWSLGLFGLLRLPLARSSRDRPAHPRAGVCRGQTVFGTPALPIDVTLACSGADALALCAAAILAYPVKWRPRLAGVVWGSGADSRSQYGADRHAGPRCCVAAHCSRLSTSMCGRRC